jgi:hypothetical protein
LLVEIVVFGSARPRGDTVHGSGKYCILFTLSLTGNTGDFRVIKY